MSKGPGRVERAIEAAFSENPLKRFYVEDLCRIVYPDHRQVSDKKRIHQRRSVLRAATRVARRMNWEHREDFSSNPDIFVGRRVYFESDEGKKALLERIRVAKGHDPLPLPELTPRELAAKARREELARLRAELPDTLAKERDELLARKEQLEIELDQVDAGLEALRLRAFHMNQTPQDEWIV